MDLFNNDPLQNILPFDGEVIYHGVIFNKNKADQFLSSLIKEIPWQQDEFVIFGKRMLTPRKVAWIANKDFAYTYSNATKIALPWTVGLHIIKQEVEQITGCSFNSCLLNLYENGEQGVSWHSDDEAALGEQPIIASVSFGALRKFSFKHKNNKQKIDINLEHGSLIMMQGNTQRHWQHAILKSKKILKPRISLTFRTIYD